MTGPEPSVTTAPAEGASPGTASPLGRRRLPPHLGPARTSTVLLALAFLAIGVLYLFVKPPDPARTAGSVTDPSPTTSRSGAPATEAPSPEATAPATTEAPPTSEVTPPPTETPTGTTDEGPVEETEVAPTSPEETTSEETTVPEGTTSVPAPTTAAPTS